MWKKFCKASAVEAGKSLVVDIEGRAVALFNAGGRFFAIDNICPHRGGPLGEGSLDGTQVTCPWHAWVFDLKTGACDQDETFKQKTYPVKVEAGEIFLEL